MSIEETTQIVKIIDEPQVEFYIPSEDGNSLDKIGRNFSCPHCEKKTDITRQITVNALDVEKNEFVTITMPEVVARKAFTEAYNSLLKRVVRAWNARGVIAKLKVLFKKEVFSFPTPDKTLWTITRTQIEGRDEEIIDIVAELESKSDS